MLTRHVAPLVTVLSMLVPAADAAVTLGTDVPVRVYDTTGTLTAANQTSLDLAASIVAAASIELKWRRCDRQDMDAKCNRPMTRDELALRLVRSPVPVEPMKNLPLGDVLLDRENGTGVLATIYVDRVEWMAKQTGADLARLLGRAIAHEIGHLLLATSAHGASGLMRAVWTRPELQRERTRDWALGPADIAAIKSRAAARVTSSRPRLPRLALR